MNIEHRTRNIQYRIKCPFKIEGKKSIFDIQKIKESVQKKEEEDIRLLPHSFPKQISFIV